MIRDENVDGACTSVGSAPAGRRVALWLLLATASVLPGCQFLQNEFFSLDRAAPGVAAGRAEMQRAALR